MITNDGCLRTSVTRSRLLIGHPNIILVTNIRSVDPNGQIQHTYTIIMVNGQKKKNGQWSCSEKNDIPACVIPTCRVRCKTETTCRYNSLLTRRTVYYIKYIILMDWFSKASDIVKKVVSSARSVMIGCAGSIIFLSKICEIVEYFDKLKFLTNYKHYYVREHHIFLEC